MSGWQTSPGGRVARWLYGVATGAALFSGMGQMPIMKRYYIADLPGLGWSEDFYKLSDLHYLAAALLLGLLAWRLVAAWREAGGLAWSWGPRSWWGWSLLAVLAATGAAKAARNAGVFISPTVLLYLDFIHLGSAMAFMFTGLFALLRPRRKSAPALA